MVNPGSFIFQIHFVENGCVLANFNGSLLPFSKKPANFYFSIENNNPHREQNMGWHLPPLNALRAFEAAGRLSSFTLAAEELHVTPGAVSRQIKLLEETLGIPLFIRNNREVAEAYLGHANDAATVTS